MDLILIILAIVVYLSAFYRLGDRHNLLKISKKTLLTALCFFVISIGLLFLTFNLNKFFDYKLQGVTSTKYENELNINQEIIRVADPVYVTRIQYRLPFCWLKVFTKSIVLMDSNQERLNVRVAETLLDPKLREK